jgi:predicted PurR-regulated permease PerM
MRFPRTPLYSRLISVALVMVAVLAILSASALAAVSPTVATVITLARKAETRDNRIAQTINCGTAECVERAFSTMPPILDKLQAATASAMRHAHSNCAVQLVSVNFAAARARIAIKSYVTYLYKDSFDSARAAMKRYTKAMLIVSNAGDGDGLARVCAK